MSSLSLIIMISVISAHAYSQGLGVSTQQSRLLTPKSSSLDVSRLRTRSRDRSRSSRTSRSRDSISDITSEYSHISSTTANTEEYPDIQDPFSRNQNISQGLIDSSIYAFITDQKPRVWKQIISDNIADQVSDTALLTYMILNPNNTVRDNYRTRHRMPPIDDFTLFESMQSVKKIFKTVPLLQAQMLEQWDLWNEHYKSSLDEYYKMDWSEATKERIINAYIGYETSKDVQSALLFQQAMTQIGMSFRQEKTRDLYKQYLDDVTALLYMIVNSKDSTNCMIITMKGYHVSSNIQAFVKGMQNVWLLVHGPRIPAEIRRDLEYKWMHYHRKFRRSSVSEQSRIREFQAVLKKLKCIDN